MNLQPSPHRSFSNCAVSYLIQKTLGTTVDDERYGQSRLALKYLGLIWKKLNLVDEGEFAVSTCYDTIDEAVEDSIDVRKEQYDKLDENTKERMILSSRITQKKIRLVAKAEGSIVIHAPIEKVFRLIAQHDCCNHWLDFVIDASYNSEQSTGVGTSAHHRGRSVGLATIFSRGFAHSRYGARAGILTLER